MTKSAHRLWSGIAMFLIAASVHGQSAPGTPLPDADVRAFVTDYEAAVNGRDVARVNAALDTSRLFDRTRRGLAVSPDMLESLETGIRSGLDWGNSMAVALGETGHYRLLKVHRLDGESRALLRLVGDNDGLNYHDVVIERAADGRLVIVDVHVFLSGEMLSETMRRSLARILPGIQGGDSTNLDAVGLLETLTEQVNAGQCAEALATYRGMPEDMQGDRVLPILLISCATASGDDTLDQVYREFRAAHPDDPCLDLLTVDWFILQERWEEAIATLGRIDLAVGGDPYVSDLLAKVHLLAGDVEKARTLARRSVDADPTLDAGYWTLLEIALLRKNHEATARLLSTLEKSYGWRFDQINDVETYADFVASPAYTQWKASRRVSDAG